MVEMKYQNLEDTFRLTLIPALGIVVTQEELNHLFDLYKKIIGSTEKIYPVLEDVTRSLLGEGRYEYRAGSRWSGDSKFVIEHYKGVYFHPNYEPKNDREEKEITEIFVSFEKETRTYLEQLKVGRKK